MGALPSSVPEDRPLNAQEQRLARWMLEHGEVEARDFLPQLERSRVVSRCPCGCPSIDLEVEGMPRSTGGMRILGDFYFGEGDGLGGVCIFERDGVLSGIEVSALAGVPAVLPDPESLHPVNAPDDAGRE